MKKIYEMPSIEQLMILSSDVITASLGKDGGFVMEDECSDFGRDEITL